MISIAEAVQTQKDSIEPSDANKKQPTPQSGAHVEGSEQDAGDSPDSPVDSSGKRSADEKGDSNGKRRKLRTKNDLGSTSWLSYRPPNPSMVVPSDADASSNVPVAPMQIPEQNVPLAADLGAAITANTNGTIHMSNSRAFLAGKWIAELPNHAFRTRNTRQFFYDSVILRSLTNPEEKMTLSIGALVHIREKGIFRLWTLYRPYKGAPENVWLRVAFPHSRNRQDLVRCNIKDIEEIDDSNIMSDEIRNDLNNYRQQLLAENLAARKEENRRYKAKFFMPRDGSPPSSDGGSNKKSPTKSEKSILDSSLLSTPDSSSSSLLQSSPANGHVLGESLQSSTIGLPIGCSDLQATPSLQAALAALNSNPEESDSEALKGLKILDSRLTHIEERMSRFSTLADQFLTITTALLESPPKK